MLSSACVPIERIAEAEFRNDEMERHCWAEFLRHTTSVGCIFVHLFVHVSAVVRQRRYTVCG